MADTNHQQGVAVAVRPVLAKGTPSASFRLRNGSLNAVRLRRVFDLFDRNGDGEITVDELAQALDALGLDADRAGLAATVGGYVPEGAAGLRFEDFDALHRALGDAFFGALPDPQDDAAAAAAEGGKGGGGGGGDEEEEEMREAFKVFDVDGDGFISAAELQEVLKKLGLPEASSMANVREMICNVDRDRDGRVDFGEFKCMMQGITVWGA
jgi:calcium-binding protein CML